MLPLDQHDIFRFISTPLRAHSKRTEWTGYEKISAGLVDFDTHSLVWREVWHGPTGIEASSANRKDRVPGLESLQALERAHQSLRCAGDRRPRDSASARRPGIFLRQ